ncbi:hypothetical protein FRB99_005265 [Tulasnella sp. 403]|nr:hypothetical protein FRB99_005265 [Tulasnella sp. 403]
MGPIPLVLWLFFSTLCILPTYGAALPSLNTNRTHQLLPRIANRKDFIEKISQPFRRVIVIVGDLHGDYKVTCEILIEARVVKDDCLTPTGEVDIVASTGDIADRGKDAMLIFHLFEHLRTTMGSENVVNVLGNHEWLNIFGDWTHVNLAEIAEEGGIEKRQRLFLDPQEPLAETLRENYVVSARIPLHPALGPINAEYDAEQDDIFGPLSHAVLSLTHGGLPVDPLDAVERYPTDLNVVGKDLITRYQSIEEEFWPKPRMTESDPLPSAPVLLTTEDVSVMFESFGPLWNREWALFPEDIICDGIDEVLWLHGVRSLIMGHTINRYGIWTRCEDKVNLIDTGMSSAFGDHRGVASALKIEYSLKPKEGEPLKFIEEETRTAVYTHRPHEGIYHKVKELNFEEK